MRLAGVIIASAAGLLLPGSAAPTVPQHDSGAAIRAEESTALVVPAPPEAAIAPLRVQPIAPARPSPPTMSGALANGVLIVVSIPSQRIFVFKNSTPWGSAPVSTGRRGHETPAGVFPILQKSVDHRSTLYNDAPMPYMQRLTWGGVALHAGALPGHRASHGCIRLPRAFAKKLYGITSYSSTAVVVTYRPVGSAEQARLLGGGEAVAPAAATPRPTADPVSTPQPSVGPTGIAQTIQLGAAPSAAGAAELWQQLLPRQPGLAGLHHEVIPALVNGRQVFRLRASGPDAHEVCSKLTIAGGACFRVGR